PLPPSLPPSSSIAGQAHLCISPHSLVPQIPTTPCLPRCNHEPNIILGAKEFDVKVFEIGEEQIRFRILLLLLARTHVNFPTLLFFLSFSIVLLVWRRLVSPSANSPPNTLYGLHTRPLDTPTLLAPPPAATNLEVVD